MRYIESLVLLLVLPSAKLVAQEQINLDSFAGCSECRLRPTLDLRLGRSVPDLIENRAARAVFDPTKREYVVMAGPATLAFFDASGRYLRQIGRAGRGPGEFRIVRHVGFSEGQTVILDVGQGRWTVLREDGRVRYHNVPVAASSSFIVVAPDTVVLAAMGTTPDDAGFPLHLIALSAGEILGHFGSETGDFNAARPWARQVLVAPSSTPRSVWLARPNRLRFEEWSLQDALLRVVEGTPDWFPPVDEIPPFGQEPPTRLRQFAVDSAGKLWVTSWVAGANWQNAVETAQRTPDGERIIDTAEYFATRVDLYDLRRKAYYGSFRWDNDQVRLLDRNGEVLIQIVEWDSDMTVFLSLYRLEPPVSGRRQGMDQ